MKILVKTVKGSMAEYEISDLATVDELKRRIASDINVPPAGQKLLHGGRVLSEDEKKLVQYGVQVKDEIILMLPKNQLSLVKVLVLPPPARPPQPRPAGGHGPEEMTVSGAAYENAVGLMINMGFTRVQVTHAMKAAFNNPNLATEYLFNGVPHDIQQLQNIAEQPDDPLSGLGMPLPFGRPLPRPGEEDKVPLHGHRFPVPPPYLGPGAPRGYPTAGVGPGRLPFWPPQPTFPGRVRFTAPMPEPEASGIQVTPEDRTVIRRLRNLGFSQEHATQAYFACDKDEKMAADFLMDNAESLHQEEEEEDDPIQPRPYAPRQRPTLARIFSGLNDG